ncbi:MAG: hypothetical protein ACRENE_33385 [Polyangiaceae bacterium]
MRRLVLLGLVDLGRRAGRSRSPGAAGADATHDPAGTPPATMRRRLYLIGCISVLVACSNASGSSTRGGADASDGDRMMRDDAASDTGATRDGPVGSDATDGDGPSSDGGDGGASDASDGGHPTSDGGDGSYGSASQRGCPPGSTGCYTVYASTDHVLFYYDIPTIQLVEVGPFMAPQVASTDGGTTEDVITDLAVTPDGRLWAISNVNLYLADTATGAVTLVGAVAKCGAGNFALTSDLGGALYTADFDGVLCRVDPTTTPPTVTVIGSLANNLAVAGDLVTVADGTTYGTAYNVSSAMSALNDTLVTLPLSMPSSVHALGMTGFPELLGVAYASGKVLAFTHDGTGKAVAIDPGTGQGTSLGMLTDPTTSRPAMIAGAGVDPRVAN